MPVEIIGAPLAEATGGEIGVGFKIVGKRDILVPLHQHIVLVNAGGRHIGGDIVGCYDFFHERDLQRAIGSHLHLAAEHFEILRRNAQQIGALQ